MKNILILFAILTNTLVFAQKPLFASAKVNSATVYFNGAEITQSASLNIPAGTNEVIIKNVADKINESTIRIGAPSNITVLSVQFTNKFISEYEIDENSPLIKKVRDSITLIEKEINKVQIEKTSHSKTIELLDKNQNVYGVNSGLSVTELMKMVEYYSSKRTELNLAISNLQEKEIKLNKILKRLNTKLEVNTKNEEKISNGKLILQIMNETAGNVPLEISYITNYANWTPFYDLRADNINTPINLLYKAQVTQNTGIDWKKVKLSLSSGTPNQNNQAPILNTWFLRYGNQTVYRNENLAMNTIQSRAEDTKESNKLGFDASSVSKHTSVNENQLNVSFDIDIPYDILSNGKKHSVALKDLKLPASYKYYAVPKIEKEAFLLAEISDYSKYNLLPGEANIIFEGLYVGKTNINPNQTSDTLNLSMGRDKKISIKREKVAEKSGTRFLSSKKEQNFTYDITIRNNKKESINLTLKDQYPISTDKEIEVELKESDRAKINHEKGILTWELKMAPNETKKIRISYQVKYPKDKIISNL